MKMENNVRFAGVNTDAKALEEQNEKLKKTVNDGQNLKKNIFDPKNYLDLKLKEHEATKTVKVRFLPISSTDGTVFYEIITHALKVDKEIAKKEQQLTKLNVYNTDLQFARNYLDLLIKNESNSFIKSINEILNYGLKTIFYDCDYSIDINIDNEKSKYNKNWKKY